MENMRQDTYQKSQQLAKGFEKCLTVYSDMVGAPDAGKKAVYGFVPGLQMSVEEQALRQQLDLLSEGIFQVLFTGGFSAGKSTLLNALMHKEILRTSINAETAVITKVVFGKAERVIIQTKTVNSRTGQREQLEMSVEDFFEKYRVDQEDPGKFQNIDYVILQQPGEGIGGTLVQLVDSPGTENSEEDTLAARSFAEKANAIVHLINSTQPFVQEDKNYIAAHYADRHLRNVFFVLNRFDCLRKKDQEDLKERARKELRSVFTDENGHFDEVLYDSRVFYTDALTSLEARTGETDAGADADTGVPKFEAALSRYLTADDRDKEAFRSYVPQLASKYASAMGRIDAVLESYRKGIDTLLQEKQSYEEKREQAQNIISQIEDNCRTCVMGILGDAKSEYDSCMNRISSNWDGHFSGVDIPFSFKEMLKLNFNKKNDAKVREITEPFAKAVGDYVKDEFQQMGAQLGDAIGNRLVQLENQLKNLQKMLENMNLPLSFDDLRHALLDSVDALGGSDPQMVEMERGNLFQIILGIIGLDPEIILDGMNGKTPNSKAIIDFLTKNILDYIAWSVVAWPIGLAMIITRIAGIIKNARNQTNTLASTILQGMRADTVSALTSEKEKYIMELENQMAVITRAGVTMTSGLKAQLRDYGVSLDDTIEKLQSAASNEQTERERTDSIRDKMIESLSEVNMLLNGKSLTDAEIRALAV